MKTIVPVLVGVSLALACAAGHAQETAKDVLKVSIERKSLRDALNDWAQQTGNQLIAEIKGEFVAPKIEGKLTAQEALEQLLEGTPLTYQWMGERLVAVKEKALVVPAALQTTEGDGKQWSVPIARFSDEEWPRQRVAANDQSSARGAEPARAQRGSRAAEDVEEVEEVIVTGTHIRGAPNNTSPVQVLDRKYIESTGVGTTTGLIEALPQNFALANQSGVLVPGVSISTVQGSAINLRGIGEGTTLTLLNGRRMALGFLGGAADISALPLSAIERVEILTDGASAIYGSDAVGGVVNFILRRDFEGAETRLRTGWAEGDVREYRASQALGHAWQSGNALVSLEYYHRDLLRASERDFIPETSEIGSLLPRDKNVSALFTGRQELTDTLSLFADGLYTKRESHNEGGRIALNENFDNDNPQLFGTVGLNWQIAGDWQIETSGTYARNKLTATGSNNESGGLVVRTDFTMREGLAIADGSLFDLAGGAVRMAVGADWRSESYEESSEFEDGFSGVGRDSDQVVRSLFTELQVPIIGPSNARTGAQRLELSLAGRYDDYSRFGSSFDPKFGLMWEPIDGVRLRGSWGTSYVAPRLVDYSLSGEVAFAFTDIDPGSPNGVSRQLIAFGTDVGNLSPQESESMSFGIEFFPRSLRALQIGLNYYKINYRDRIAFPPLPSVILGNPSSFGSLIIRNPTAEQVMEFVTDAQQGQGFLDCDIDCLPDPGFDPASIEVIVDDRKRNLSETSTSGFDASIEYALAAAGGEFQFGLAGTYILELEQKVAAGADSFDTVDTYNNPPNWRLRTSVGYQRQGWTANLFVSHTSSYTDNRPIVPVPVDSYTTADARLAYDLSTRFHEGFASGVTVSAAIQNLLDEDPPRTAVLNADSDMGFDPTNANALGRFFSIEFQKAW